MGKLHSTSRWQKVRAYHLTMNPMCKMCWDLGKRSAAQVVDHITPHREDVVLFWDTSNLQSLCTRCHNVVKQSHEKRGGVVGYGRDGIPLDPNHHWHGKDSDEE